MSVLKLLILLLIVVGIPLYVWFYKGEFLRSFDNLEEARAFLEGYKFKGYWAYLGIQVLQIVISIIPGQFTNMAAGYLFGFPAAFVISVIGAIAGTFITYFIAKLLGAKAMKQLIEPERYKRFLKRFNSKRSYITVFILYLVPGLPKDVLGYVAGVSKMNFVPFLFLSVIGRLPALSVSVMVGSMIYKEIYTGVIILILLMVIISMTGILYRKKLLRYIDSGYSKYIKKGENQSE